MYVSFSENAVDCVCCSGLQAGVRCVRSVLHGLDTMSSKEMVSTETGQCDVTPAWRHISADNCIIWAGV